MQTWYYEVVSIDGDSANRHTVRRPETGRTCFAAGGDQCGNKAEI